MSDIVCSIVFVFLTLLWGVGAIVYLVQMINREREIRTARAQIEWYESIISEMRHEADQAQPSRW